MPLDADVRAEVLRVLGQPVLGTIRFPHRFGRVDSRHFADVKAAIEDGRIAVRHDGALPWMGCYRAGSNTLVFQAVPAGHAAHACVVHECVHAGCDVRGYSWLTKGISEAIAFVAESWYAKVAYGGQVVSGHSDPATRAAEDALFVVARELAEMLFRGETPADADWDAVVRAVYTVPTYRFDLSFCGYDGIPAASR